MNNKLLKKIAVFFVLVVLIFIPVAILDTKTDTKIPNGAKYVFLFIGDGTSFPQRNITELFLASLSAPFDPEPTLERSKGNIPLNQGISDFKPSATRLLMNSFPTHGISTTFSANSLITDSSSSATAIASGKKTLDGVVGMDPKAKENYISIAKIAKDKGRKVGIITSVSLEHATPGAFYAHSPSRQNFYDIGVQLTQSNFDFFGGGGFFQPKGKNNDQKSIEEYANEAGYTMINSREDFEKLKTGDKKIIASSPILDSDFALPYAIDNKNGGIELHEFVKKGIELLKNPDGFFMMVEGGKVDWACHRNDVVTAIYEVIALDKAVKVAYEFYEKYPDETLIIVTGDHETGGLSVGYNGTRYDTFFTKLYNQKISFAEFNKIVKNFREEHSGKFEDFIPIVNNFFGSFDLKPEEEKTLRDAFAMSMTDPKSRSTNNYNYVLSYGIYENEPVTATLTQILNQKSGIAWTTTAHTGLPTPVSAIGVGHEKFAGWYDNTDIFKKLLENISN